MRWLWLGFLPCLMASMLVFWVANGDRYAIAIAVVAAWLHSLVRADAVRDAIVTHNRRDPA